MELVFLVASIFRSLLFLFGVPGNILVILVYRKRKVGGSTRIYIIAMAIFDLAVCLLSPVVIYQFTVFHNYPSLVLCEFVTFSTLTLMFLSLILMMMIGVDRYVKVCQSQRIKTSPKRAIIVITLSVIACSAVTIPYFFTPHP